MVERLVYDYYDNHNDISWYPFLKDVTRRGIKLTAEQIDNAYELVTMILNEINIIKTCKDKWYTKEAQRYQNEFGFTGWIY